MVTFIPSATTEITCEALPEDPHGRYKNENCTARNSTNGATCELECDVGYESSDTGRMSGDVDVQTCQLDGTWSSHAHCVGEKRKKSLSKCACLQYFYDNIKPPDRLSINAFLYRIQHYAKHKYLHSHCVYFTIKHYISQVCLTNSENCSY